MAKLSENQQKAVDALRTQITESGAEYATKTAWKASAPKGVTITTSTLVNAGAVTEIKVAINGSRVTEAYKPTAAAE